MRQPLWRQWLMMSALGAVPVLGCSHADHQCDCYSTRGPTVYVLPSPPPASTVVTAKPVPTTPVDAPKVETTSLVTTPGPKKSEPTTIAVPVVGGAEYGSKTGTLELSTADAEAMGVRPGYTPGALFMPPK